MKLKNIKADSTSPEEVELALTRYQEGSMTTDEIAKLANVCPATLTVWVKKAGMHLRQRGRRRLVQPTPLHLKILELAGHQRYDQIGETYGMRKQSIHRIIKRWRGWNQSSKAPFEPGDVISWKGRRLTVIDANAKEGTLVDEKNQQRYTKFPWAGTSHPRKIGVSKEYQVAA